MYRHLVLLVVGFTVLKEVHGYRKFDVSIPNDNAIEDELSATTETVSSPLSSRIKKLPSRYTQHYFRPFQPAVSTESKTWMTFPTSAANFFGPQSYWSQLANRLIDSVGGTYAQYATNLRKKTPKTDRLALFRHALKIENSTRVHQGNVMKGQKNYHQNVVDVNVDGRETVDTEAQSTVAVEFATRPPLDESSKASLKPISFVENDYSTEVATLSSTSLSTPFYVEPTRFPPSPPPSTTESPYGVLPNLLMRDPNARTKFYHLDRVANPQIRPTEITSKTTQGTEIRRKPAIKLSLPAESASESDFREAFRRVLVDYQKHHGAVTTTTTTTVSPEFREGLTSREEMLYARLAQLKAVRANRRRHPIGSEPSGRRIVILPSRFDEDTGARWRH